MSRVIVEIGKKRYRVIKDGECSKRGCSLYKRGVCDFDGEDNDSPKAYPCDKIIDAIHSYGLCISLGNSYKEVK